MAGESENVVEFKNVTKIFNEGTPRASTAIRDVSFKVENRPDHGGQKKITARFFPDCLEEGGRRHLTDRLGAACAERGMPRIFSNGVPVVPAAAAFWIVRSHDGHGERGQDAAHKAYLGLLPALKRFQLHLRYDQDGGQLICRCTDKTDCAAEKD